MESVAPLLLLFSFTGYAFARAFHVTHYRSEALQWEQNLFETAFIGGALFFITRTATVPLLVKKWPELPTLWNGFRHTLLIPYTGSFILSIASGLLLGFTLNLFFPREWAIRFAVKRFGSELVQFLHSAAVAGIPVSLTMAHRKVYVGFVMSPPTLNFPYTRILPTLSGHRATETLELTFDTEYFPVYDALEKRRKKGHLVIDDEHFGIVLPVDQISSANFFDNETYVKHFQQKSTSKRPKK